MWKYADLTQIHYLTERKKKRYWNNVRLSNYFKDFDQTIEVENQQEANTVCVSVPGAFNACKHSHLQTHNLINSHYEYQEEEKKKKDMSSSINNNSLNKNIKCKHNMFALLCCAVQDLQIWTSFIFSQRQTLWQVDFLGIWSNVMLTIGTKG